MKKTIDVEEGLHLVIVRKEADGWVVDEDSHYLLEYHRIGGSNAMELGVQTICSLIPIEEDGASRQTKIVADYIMGNIPGEPSQDEGAGNCAVRLLDTYRSVLRQIMDELGVPTATYPAPVANAYGLAKCALEDAAGRRDEIDSSPELP